MLFYYVLNSMLWCPLWFPHTKDVRFVQLFLWRHISYFRLCVCLRIVVSNANCVVLLFCLSSSCVLFPVSLDCPFLIAPSVFSTVYIIISWSLSCNIQNQYITITHQVLQQNQYITTTHQVLQQNQYITTTHQVLQQN